MPNKKKQTKLLERKLIHIILILWANSKYNFYSIRKKKELSADGTHLGYVVDVLYLVHIIYIYMVLFV